MRARHCLDNPRAADGDNDFHRDGNFDLRVGRSYQRDRLRGGGVEGQ